MKKVNFIRKRAIPFKRICKTNFITILGGLIVLTTLLHPDDLFGNNISVSGLSFSQGAGTVTFTLSWEHSWRNTSATPNNWDAAWVFVKWRDCSATSSVQFTHGLVSTTTTDHNFNINSGATTYQPTMRDGTVGIDASPDNTGVMLRNSADPATGTVSATVTLKLTNMPASGTLDIRVFAIETVFIPQGAYTLGDGTGSIDSVSRGSFTTTNAGATSAVITSENAIDVFENDNCACTPGPCSLTAAFPKGYNSFYMMKYEISQGQYADFLNATFATAQTAHYSGRNGQNRFTIANTGNPPNVFVAGRPSRACNWLNFDDLTAYLDWAALRPFTELEYEKACRGTNGPAGGEYAWGNAMGTRATTISGIEDGTETITTFGANIASSTGYTGGDGDTGPLRCGIFATGASVTRTQTGASFYGIMELSGNVDEYYIHARAGRSGDVSASGVSLGNGSLSATGNQDVANWPNATNLPYFVIRRGGGSASGFSGFGIHRTDECNVSYRGHEPNISSSISQYQTRYAGSGGRGGR